MLRIMLAVLVLTLAACTEKKEPIQADTIGGKGGGSATQDSVVVEQPQ